MAFNDYSVEIVNIDNFETDVSSDVYKNVKYRAKKAIRTKC